MDRIRQEELKTHLLATSDEFRRLANEHAEYARKIDALEALPYRSEEQQIEETRLKKLKLHAKDLMADLINRHRAQMV